MCELLSTWPMREVPGCPLLLRLGDAERWDQTQSLCLGRGWEEGGSPAGSGLLVYACVMCSLGILCKAVKAAVGLGWCLGDVGGHMVSMSVSKAAIMKYSRLGSLNGRNLFSHSLEAECLRSRCWQDPFLLSPLPLACRRLSSPCVFTRSSLCVHLCSNLLFL